MSEYTARIYEFGCAFGTQYVTWVGLVVMGLDQLLSRNFWPKKALDWLDRYWPEEKRHRFFKWLAIIGFAFASFRAFDHVNQEAKRLDGALQTAKTDLLQKQNELATTQRALADTQQHLQEANAKFASVAPTPSLEQSKAAFDIGGNGNISAKQIQTCGEMTVVRSQPGSGGNLTIEGLTSVAPNAECRFPPPSEASKQLSNRELKEQAISLAQELDAFNKRIDDQEIIRLTDKQRKALDDKTRDELKFLYLERATELARAITARTGPVEIPAPKDPYGVQESLTRTGRSALLFGKLFGPSTAHGIANYLRLIAGKLSE